MSRERNKTYDPHDNPHDPPDVIAIEMPRARRIGIEHTQIVPQNRESVEAWRRFRRELDSVTPPIGTYIVGPATLHDRFPRTTGSMADVIKHVLDAIRIHSTWTPGTSITVPAEPQIKVMMIADTGAGLWGLPSLGRHAWPNVLEALGERLDRKVAGTRRWQPVDERIFLLDPTSASPITHVSLVEHLLDDVWFLNERGLLPFNCVYLVRGKDVEPVWPN